MTSDAFVVLYCTCFIYKYTNEQKGILSRKLICHTISHSPGRFYIARHFTFRKITANLCVLLFVSVVCSHISQAGSVCTTFYKSNVYLIQKQKDIPNCLTTCIYVTTTDINIKSRPETAQERNGRSARIRVTL